MSVKALGIALKLTLSGMNQLVYPQTWVFTFVVITCVLTQMNYLNKVITSSLLFYFSQIIFLCMLYSQKQMFSIREKTLSSFIFFEQIHETIGGYFIFQFNNLQSYEQL